MEKIKLLKETCSLPSAGPTDHMLMERFEPTGNISFYFFFEE